MLPIVLAIWGIIGWKAYATFGGNNKNAVASIPQNEKINSQELPDTIKLIANYRDPFLDKSVENPDRKKNKSTLQAQAVKPKPKEVKPILWPKVAYHGLVKKSNDNKTVGFLGVDGKSYFVQSGEEAGLVSVGKLWKDSVEVFWGKEKLVLKK